MSIAKWLFINFGTTEECTDYYKCCNCQQVFSGSGCYTDFKSGYCSQFKFCPHCGIEFKGEVKNSRFSYENDEPQLIRPKYRQTSKAVRTSEEYMEILKNRVGIRKNNIRIFNMKWNAYIEKVEEYLDDWMEFDNSDGRIRKQIQPDTSPM